MRKILLPAVAFVVLVMVGQAAAAEATFLTPGHPDLTKPAAQGRNSWFG
jgi:hypothetical protein